MQPLRDVLDSGCLANPQEDADLIKRSPDPDDLIYLSLGETWIPPAPGLIKALGEVPDYSHGYTLSPYGLPSLRRTLRDYIVRTHRLSEANAFDVAVSQAGTRAAMSDFGRLILELDMGAPAILVPDPGWDYAGVFAPLGFEVKTFRLEAARGWMPDPDEVEASLAPGYLLVINAQHNPTGYEWSEEIVSKLISLAFERKAAVLIDDAYYALHAPGKTPTNALGLLTEIAGTRETPPWLAVRTLGKQFRTNGWSIGAMTAPPSILERLADIQHRRTYGSALPLQAAMKTWLENPDADAYLEDIRDHYASARNTVAELLTGRLGFPADKVFPGTCTSYMRYVVPPRFTAEGTEKAYRLLCTQAGVLPGEGSMTDTPSSNDLPCVRIHLGYPVHVLEEAFNRLRNAGLGWDGNGV